MVEIKFVIAVQINLRFKDGHAVCNPHGVENHPSVGARQTEPHLLVPQIELQNRLTCLERSGLAKIPQGIELRNFSQGFRCGDGLDDAVGLLFHE